MEAEPAKVVTSTRDRIEEKLKAMKSKQAELQEAAEKRKQEDSDEDPFTMRKEHKKQDVRKKSRSRSIEARAPKVDEAEERER